MPQSNAERQAAYRQRKSALRNARATGIGVTNESVTRDFWDALGEHIYLGDWGFGPRFALVATDKNRHLIFGAREGGAS